MARTQRKIDKKVVEAREKSWTPDLILPVAFHEAFAQECLRTNDLGDAYAAAHWRTEGTPPPEGSNWGRSQYLRHMPNVDARIVWLRKAYLSQLKVSAETIAQELDEARALATALRKPDTMINATMNKAKIYGIGEKGQQGGLVPGVMLVPSIGSPDDWERAAMAAQKTLQEQSSE